MATREMTEPLGFRLIEELFQPWNGAERNRYAYMMTAPLVNVIENESYYILALAVPGIKKEALNITLDGSILSVSSQKEEIKERYTWEEFNLDSFVRSFTLPDDVKPDLIEAKYEDGLLRIVLPRKAEVKQTTVITQITVH